VLLIYNILVGFAFIFILPFVIWKYKAGFFKKVSIGLNERFGLYNIPQGKYILLHASSVGELKTVEIFVRGIKKRFPEKRIIILTMTPYGYRYAYDNRLGDEVAFAPIDIPFFVERVFNKITPEMLILVESELWPNLIFSAKGKGAKIVSINARMSDRSFKRYGFIREFMSEIVNSLDLICARENSDAEKFSYLGYGRAKVKKTGNMKYDGLLSGKPVPQKMPEDFGFSSEDMILVAGSTRDNEEEVVLWAYKNLFKDIPNLKIIIAPRYPERCKDVAALLQKIGITFVERSAFKDNVSFHGKQCLLLDTIGELAAAYSTASVVFVGGSLYPGAGGHNILEPAALGKAVVFGKYMSNFKEPSESLVAASAAYIAYDKEDLYNKLLQLLNNEQTRNECGARARNIVHNQVGATERNIEIISDMLTMS